jgi:ubiquinone biosynthesis protein COQ9
MDIIELKDKLLAATLANVLFDGWTDHALRSAGTAVGVGPEMVLHAFPEGITEVAAHFSDWADRTMVAAYGAEDTVALGMSARVALAVRLRLEALEEHREALRSWLAWLALPAHAPLALRLLHRTVDEIWHTVGDRSTDLSYYTKRAMLAGVLSATVLHWLGDESEHYTATRDFLERSLKVTTGVGRSMAQAGELGRMLDLAPSPIRFARQLRRRFAGL